MNLDVTLPLCGGDIRLNFVLNITASTSNKLASSKLVEGRTYLPLSNLLYLKNNSRIITVEANDLQNK